MQAEKNIAIRTWLKWKWYIKPEVTLIHKCFPHVRVETTPGMGDFFNVWENVEAEPVLKPVREGFFPAPTHKLF